MKRIPVENKKAMAAIIIACAVIVSAAGFITWRMVTINDISAMSTAAAESSTLSTDLTNQADSSSQTAAETQTSSATPATVASTNRTTTETAKTETATTTFATTQEPPITTPANIEAGATVNFGSYEQDGQSLNGKERIVWKVLEVKDGKALLLSEKVLDGKQYHNFDENITWENCSLRTWLNNYFYITAFNTNEQKLIATTTITNKNLPYSETERSNDTQDKVFCLSQDELTKYFKDYERAVSPTTYARYRGITLYGFAEVGQDTPENWGACVWWLRTTGSSPNSACSIGMNGNDRVTYSNGIRPAIWVNLS